MSTKRERSYGLALFIKDFRYYPEKVDSTQEKE